MYKVRSILKVTTSHVHLYPNYKSPQARFETSRRKDIAIKYADIKTTIPEEDIVGYERHFIRGLIDGDGTLSIRKNRYGSLRLGFIDEYQNIVEWTSKTICETLGLPEKVPRYVPQSHVWEILWEGTIARLIAWWLYHGDIDTCCLSRKRNKYLKQVLDGKTFSTTDEEILYVAKAEKVENKINFKLPFCSTLDWCHRIQKLLSFNTVPVFNNPGKRKYYNLYIPIQKKCIANTQDRQEKLA